MPEIVVGTAAFGLPYGLGRDGQPPALMSEAEVRALVEHALARGVTTFDTAPAYGSSEARLGATLGARGRVWTKRARSGDDVTASLARLGRERIDLLQWHNWTASVGEPPGWPALRGDSRIGELGATTYGREDALAAVRSGWFDVVQVEWNLLNQGVVQAIGEEALARGVRIAVRSVFLQGALTDDARTLPPEPVLIAGVERARQVAAAMGVSLSELALGAALGHPRIGYVLVGVDRPEQIDAAVEGRRLDPASVRGLDLGGDPATDPRRWGRPK